MNRLYHIFRYPQWFDTTLEYVILTVVLVRALALPRLY